MAQQLRSIMTNDVYTIEANQSIQEAAQLMSDHNIGALPVVENGKMVGMITDRDITLRSTAEGANVNKPVSEVMTNEKIQASPDMDVQQAANIMSERQVRRLPVVENGQVIGMVSLGDIATDTPNEAQEALSSISTPSKPQH